MTLNNRVADEEWTGRDLKGKSRGLIHGTISWFVSRDWRKLQEISVRISGTLAEFRGRCLPDSFQTVTAMRPPGVVVCNVSRSASGGMADNHSHSLLHAIHIGTALVREVQWPYDVLRDTAASAVSFLIVIELQSQQKLWTVNRNISMELVRH